MNLNKTLKQFLPASAFQQDWEEQLQSTNAADWRPPGELVHAYSKKGKDFEVWAGSLLNPKINKLVENFQVLVLFYIEAGSELDLKEVDWSLNRWRVYLVFEKVEPSIPTASSYSFIGYSTTYRFWRYAKSTSGQRPKPTSAYPALPAIAPQHLDSRLRISQFLLLPPYQKAGHGSQLYQAIYNEVLVDPTVNELTVEDPSEEFDQLRDSCDWKVLEPAFREAKIRIDSDKPSSIRRIRRIPTPMLLDVSKLKSIRKETKIAPRQFARLTELYLLSLIPFSHRSTGGASLTKLKIRKHENKDVWDRTYYWWRLLLKQRIFKKNKEMLREADPEEKWNGLEDSARGQEDEYEGLLMLFALRQAGQEGLVGGNGKSSASTSRKRKVIEEDDDDDDDEEVEEIEVSLTKRSRSEA